MKITKNHHQTKTIISFISGGIVLLYGLGFLLNPQFCKSPYLITLCYYDKSMLQNLILGIIQGITEFLPVSSSGHLFLTQFFLGIDPNIALEVYLHAASLLAVILFFHQKIWSLIQDFLRGILNHFTKKETFTQNANAVLTLKLLVATLITVPVALLTREIVFADLDINRIAIALLVTGGMIFGAEKFRSKTPKKFSWNTVYLLGIIQGMAVIPGISRSGATIALLIFLGINRKQSAEISFLLSIPTILAALIFILFEQGFANFTLEILGATTACFIASVVAIKWMMKLIEHQWLYFVPYCLILGIALLFT